MGNYFCKNNQINDFQIHPQIIKRMNREFDDFIKYGKRINLSQNLLDIQDGDIKIPAAEFDTELTFPSGDFQKIIRDMINIAENIEIKSIGNKLILSCNGDFASQSTMLCETQNGLQFIHNLSSEFPV